MSQTIFSPFTHNSLEQLNSLIHNMNIFYSGHNLWVKLYFPPSYTTAKSNSFTQLNSLIHNMNILWFRLDLVSNTIHNDKCIEHKSISFQCWKNHILYEIQVWISYHILVSSALMSVEQGSDLKMASSKMEEREWRW